jgi:mRNA-degrading endonuclease toxin of MazEF toxin-antitoxin module
VRPALIVRDQIDQDIICLPITSSFGTSDKDIEVQTSQTIGFTFPITSFVRTQKITTLNQNLIIKNLGRLEETLFQKIKQTYLSFLTS